MTKNNKRESTDDLNHSRYLTKADCGESLQGRIKSVVKENVAPLGAEPELGRVVLFANLEKGLDLNKTKGAQITAIAGSKYYEDWPETVIEMYDDPTITFAGKVTGGIRIRKTAKPHRSVGFNETSSDDAE